MTRPSRCSNRWARWSRRPFGSVIPTCTTPASLWSLRVRLWRERASRCCCWTAVTRREVITVPSRLQGSISRPTSTLYPTRFETAQNGSQFVFHAVYQSTDQKWPLQTVFKQKNPEENDKLLNIWWTVLIHNPASDKSVFNAFLGDFSNRKLWFLESSENFGHFWSLLATSGHFWPLLATFDHFFLAYKYFGKTL